MTDRLDVPTRRGFLAGVGAAIVVARAAAILDPGAIDVAARTLTPIELRIFPKFPAGYVTADYMVAVIRDVGEQVAALGPLAPAEAIAVGDQLDAIIDSIRPIGVLVNVEASLVAIADGRFELVDVAPGCVAIRAPRIEGDGDET